MRNRMYGGVRGRKTKVGRKLLRFPPTRFYTVLSLLQNTIFAFLTAQNYELSAQENLWLEIREF